MQLLYEDNLLEMDNERNEQNLMWINNLNCFNTNKLESNKLIAFIYAIA
jgi:hypothetical protein